MTSDSAKFRTGNGRFAPYGVGHTGLVAATVIRELARTEGGRMLGRRRGQRLLHGTLGRFIEGLTRPEREIVPPRSGTDAVVDCALYRGGTRRSGRLAYADAARQAKRHRDSFVWLGLHEPGRAEMASIARAFGLHELTADQAVAAGHRPAAETIGDVTRLVLRTARYVEHAELTATSEVVDTGDVTVLIGPRWVITVRHGAAGALRPVREDLEQRPTLLTEGPWAVAWAVCSRMVDLYLDVAGHVERDLERLEEEAFTAERSPEISHIYQLKREMVEFKRAVLPLQDPLARLLELPDLPAELRPWFIDVRSRLSRAVDRVAGFDDLVNSILQARLAQVSVDQNNDMRKIASWAAIAAVPTVVAGIYGMNFDVMPGSGWRYGFWAVVLVTAGAGVFLHRRLKKVGWL